MITELQPGEVIVVGTNRDGRHLAGAAAQAHKDFGLAWGTGEGLSGQTYALPTMEGNKPFQTAIDHFVRFAAEHPKLTFLLTKVGTGIAGYDEAIVRDMFAAATLGVWPSNVIKPEDW